MGIELIIGAAMPVIIEFIAKYIKSTNGKFVVSLILPLLAGVAINFQNIGIDNVDMILGSGAIIFTAAQGIYKLYFRDSAIQRAIAD